MSITTFPFAAGRPKVRLLGLVACLLLVLAAPFRVSAAPYAAIVMDADTGTVLHADRADDRRYPASLAKMMTLYLVFEALERRKVTLETRMKVSARASKQPPTRLGLKAGSSLKVEQAILGLVAKSANDAAVVVAEHLAGSESAFTRRMTERARQLGMKATIFRNPHGLPNEKQVTTARDMALLARALIRDFPQYYEYFSRSSFTFNGIVHRSHNRLMARYKGMDGLKTGYIRASGFNLAASAKRDGRRLVAIVLGGKSAAWRDQRMADLLDDGFRKARSLPPPVTAPLPGRKPLLAGTGASALPVEGWGIQVGAFSNPEDGRHAALRIAQSLPNLLGSAVPLLMEVATPEGRLFRARLMGIDELSARAACAQLERTGHGCFTVPGGS